MSDVDGMNTRRSMLKQTIDETTGRCAEIRGYGISDDQSMRCKGHERARQFFPPTRYVRWSGRPNDDLGIDSYRRSGFVNGHAVDFHEPRHHEGLCARARFGKSAFHEKYIQARLGSASLTHGIDTPL